MRRLLVALVVVGPFAVPGCLFGRVTPQDCEAWGEHYQKTLEAQGGKKLAKCLDGGGLKKAKKQLTENIETTKEALLTTCKGLAGTLPKSKKDEECFLSAKTADDWGKCNFSSTSPLFVWGGTPDAAKASWAGLCAVGGGPSAGDDDDDGPHKSKKKKAKKADEDDD